MPEPRTFVLWGASGHARVLADAIGLHGGRVTALFDNDTSVLQCLPGVPVLHGDNGHWTGVAAVIDKDLTSAMLAAHLHADALIMLTGVE